MKEKEKWAIEYDRQCKKFPAEQKDRFLAFGLDKGSVIFVEVD